YFEDLNKFHKRLSYREDKCLTQKIDEISYFEENLEEKIRKDCSDDYANLSHTHKVFYDEIRALQFKIEQLEKFYLEKEFGTNYNTVRPLT
ncbi:11719_t:CDS:1, partial [Gigaspora margarita]